MKATLEVTEKAIKGVAQQVRYRWAFEERWQSLHSSDDCWQGYNTLDTSGFKHYRINHSQLFADKKNHINGIENFWNQAKRHMRKFNGIPKWHFWLFLKECEWRFNNPNPKSQLALLLSWVKPYL